MNCVETSETNGVEVANAAMELIDSEPVYQPLPLRSNVEQLNYARKVQKVVDGFTDGPIHALDIIATWIQQENRRDIKTVMGHINRCEARLSAASAGALSVEDRERCTAELAIWKDKLPAICLGKSLSRYGPEKKASDSLDMAVWALLARDTCPFLKFYERYCCEKIGYYDERWLMNCECPVNEAIAALKKELTNTGAVPVTGERCAERFQEVLTQYRQAMRVLGPNATNRKCYEWAANSARGSSRTAHSEETWLRYLREARENAENT